ncbi:hypothetical protein PVAP13_3KG263452 [Panicum virgatum]|uniref:Uncharacterized protein n=1 Tax=Panicum virgatum TaxID=38727 RepID=A0A8T0V0L6_PANVG|nr:hypothetical protein PVAP13_3KG263452 [Panicum virgatum]
MRFSRRIKNYFVHLRALATPDYSSPMTISARLPAQRQHLSRRRRPTLIFDDHLGSAARRAAAPLVVDDHLGSAASRAASPLIVDDPTSARPPAERQQPSSSMTTSTRPPAGQRHPSSSTTILARPPVERQHPSCPSSSRPSGCRHGCPLTEPGRRAAAGTLRGAKADIILAHEEPPQNDNTDMAFYERPTTSATAPSWLALHIQAQRFKPNTDSTMTLPQRRQGHKRLQGGERRRYRAAASRDESGNMNC